MITLSNIRDYLYCPEKLNLRLENSDIQTEAMVTGKIFKEAYMGFTGIVQRNIWGLSGEFSIKEILNELFKDVPEFIDTIYHRYEEEGIDDPTMVFKKLKEDLRFNSWLIALKTQKILRDGRIGSEVVNILFPPCFMDFKIENKEVGLGGRIDKIEIIDGDYYPIKIQGNLPPLKGLWESDKIQIAAYSFLIEEEFNKDVQVGFINYVKTGSKKPVINSAMLNDKFIEMFEEVRSMIYDGNTPKFHLNINKCRSCEYSEICQYCKTEFNGDFTA